MSRRYELKRRAERQAETRRRIVEAAVELHTTVGPARTTVSAIADLAGVQRHTFYRHFPDERSLGFACSGLFMEEHPLPDPEPWFAMPAGRERLGRALGELYAYFDENGERLAPIVRDAEIDPLTRELFELQTAPLLARMAAVLLEGLPELPRVRAAVELALDLHTWRRLRWSGLGSSEAARLMADVVVCSAA